MPNSAMMFVGCAPIFFQTAKYVELDLSFRPYRIHTPFGSGEVNVSRTFLKYYPERLAVALTAWGEIREKFGAAFERVCARHGRHEVRKAFIESVEYELIF